MDKHKLKIMIVSIIAFFVIISCITTKDSPAPGCDQHLGCAPMGGCFGKTIIQDLKVEGAPDCLKVSVNNCNGGVIELDNACSDALHLGEMVINAGENAIFDVSQEGESFTLIHISSNFSEYIPEMDQVVRLTGALGDQQIVISFTKTAPLCD